MHMHRNCNWRTRVCSHVHRHTYVHTHPHTWTHAHPQTYAKLHIHTHKTWTHAHLDLCVAQTMRSRSPTARARICSFMCVRERVCVCVTMPYDIHTFIVAQHTYIHRCMYSYNVLRSILRDWLHATTTHTHSLTHIRMYTYTCAQAYKDTYIHVCVSS